MTLRELKQTKLFPDDTLIFFNRSEGCQCYIAEMEHRVNIGNCTHTLIDKLLDCEINFLQPTRDALIVYLMEDC